MASPKSSEFSSFAITALMYACRFVANLSISDISIIGKMNGTLFLNEK